jgi:cyclic dehypoxanthinyl futalosine synthase
VANIQSSWVTQGREIGQLALLFGANDMGSLMLEENVVSAAGTVHHLTLEQMRSAISELGWVPRRRNVFYELFEDDDAVTPVDPAREKARSVHIPVAATTP